MDDTGEVIKLDAVPEHAARSTARCAARRARVAAEKLKARGFENVSYIAGTYDSIQ